MSTRSNASKGMAFGLVLAALGASGAKAFGQSHAYVNSMRSSTETNVFVQQNIEAEYGKYTSVLEDRDDMSTGTPTTTAAAGTANNSNAAKTTNTTRNFWKGYGIGTTIGLEMMKFVQVVAGHTFVNMQYKEDALESLSGSRVHAGMRLSFSSPIGNLEGGGGLQGSRLDYRKRLENASFYGSGVYYSLGLNYFISTKVSFYYEAKLEKEHLVRNGGSSVTQSIDTDSTLMGLGFRIWL